MRPFSMTKNDEKATKHQQKNRELEKSEKTWCYFGQSLPTPGPRFIFLNWDAQVSPYNPVSDERTISTKKQKFDEVFCDVSSSNIETLGDVLEAEAFVDRTNVSDAVSAVDYNACMKTLCVQS